MYAVQLLQRGKVNLMSVGEDRVKEVLGGGTLHLKSPKMFEGRKVRQDSGVTCKLVNYCPNQAGEV